MFRTLFGIVFTLLGLFFLASALAGTHGNLPTDPTEIHTWLFWIVSFAPLTVGMVLFCWKPMRRAFR